LETFILISNGLICLEQFEYFKVAIDIVLNQSLYYSINAHNIRT